GVQSSDDRRNTSRSRNDGLLLLERIRFTHVISSSLHCLQNFFRDIHAFDSAKRASETTSYGGMAAVEQQPQYIRGIPDCSEHHLSFNRTALNKGFGDFH